MVWRHPLHTTEQMDEPSWIVLKRGAPQILQVPVSGGFNFFSLSATVLALSMFSPPSVGSVGGQRATCDVGGRPCSPATYTPSRRLCQTSSWRVHPRLGQGVARDHVGLRCQAGAVSIQTRRGLCFWLSCSQAHTFQPLNRSEPQCFKICLFSPITTRHAPISSDTSHECRSQNPNLTGVGGIR